MKLILQLLLIITFTAINTLNLYAGTGHSHNVSIKEINKIAKIELKKLIKTKRIDVSWKNAKKMSTKQQKTSSGKEWIVSFKNKNVKNISKQIIYIYLTTYGKFKGANYKGN